MKVYVTANGKSAELTNEHLAASKESPILVMDGLAYDPGDAYLEGVVVEGPDEHPLVMRWRDRTRTMLGGLGAFCEQCGHYWLTRNDQSIICPYCGASN
jgi:hypothetical protein